MSPYIPELQGVGVYPGGTHLNRKRSRMSSKVAPFSSHV